MAVKAKDIALLAGVSQQTVSAALGGHGRVGAETRSRIVALAEQLHYVPNQAARSLSGHRTRTIGILGEFGIAVYTYMQRELSQYLRGHGYHVLVQVFDPEVDAQEAAVQALVSLGVEGIIMIHSRRRVEPSSHQGIPLVYCSRMHPDGYDVGVDAEESGYLGTAHLCRHGHRRIAYVQVTSAQGGRRRNGWERALRESGVEAVPAWRMVLRDFNGEAERLLAALSRQRITAVMAANDFVAAQLMGILIRRGVRVPEDCALVGADGYTFADTCPVSLSTVILPVQACAEQAVTLLLQRIRSGSWQEPPANVRIAPRLYTGRSCGCPERERDWLYRVGTADLLERAQKVNFNRDILAGSGYGEGSFSEL